MGRPLSLLSKRPGTRIWGFCCSSSSGVFSWTAALTWAAYGAWTSFLPMQRHRLAEGLPAKTANFLSQRSARWTPSWDLLKWLALYPSSRRFWSKIIFLFFHDKFFTPVWSCKQSEGPSYYGVFFRVMLFLFRRRGGCWISRIAEILKCCFLKVPEGYSFFCPHHSSSFTVNSMNTHRFFDSSCRVSCGSSGKGEWKGKLIKVAEPRGGAEYASGSCLTPWS